MGFTDILFQVRGNGTVFFKSDYEPWAYELFSEDSNYENLGWDPLQSAIDFCRIYNLKIHAYINVLPGWKGTKDPPISNGNLWSSRKDLIHGRFNWKNYASNFRMVHIPKSSSSRSYFTSYKFI